MTERWYEAAAVERYLGLGFNSELSSIHQCDHYAAACNEIAFILRHAYSESPKSLQSFIFEDTLCAFRLLPLFPVQTQSVILAANTLLQSAESALPKKKKVLAIAGYKHAMVACKRRSKAQQGLGLAQLPDDILQLMFGHLDLHSLAYASMVCRSWHAAAHEDHLWKLLYVNFFNDHEKCLSFDSLRGGIQNKRKVNNESQSDVVDINKIDWREAFKEMYMGLSSKNSLHYRGYCKSCNLIVWLNDAKCYKQHSGKDSPHCKIDPISMDQIVEHVLYGSLPSECSSDSDSDDSSVFKAPHRLWRCIGI